MQFIKFIFNTLKILVPNLFHSFHIKESKKNIVLQFDQEGPQIITQTSKKTMFLTFKISYL